MDKRKRFKLVKKGDNSLNYKKQVKLFVPRGGIRELEDEINEFLSTVNYADVLDISQSLDGSLIIIEYRVLKSK